MQNYLPVSLLGAGKQQRLQSLLVSHTQISPVTDVRGLLKQLTGDKADKRWKKETGKSGCCGETEKEEEEGVSVYTQRGG